MPSFEEHGLDLDLEGIVDAHIPGLRRDLFLQISRKPEHTVEFGRLELILASLGGRPFNDIKGLRHDIPADIHIIIKIQIDPDSDQILQFMLFVQIFHVKLARHGLRCLDPGKASVIQPALLQPVADDPPKVLFHDRRDLDRICQLLFCERHHVVEKHPIGPGQIHFVIVHIIIHIGSSIIARRVFRLLVDRVAVHVVSLSGRRIRPGDLCRTGGRSSCRLTHRIAVHIISLSGIGIGPCDIGRVR